MTLDTVLQLMHSKSDGKYYIESQNDLYQVDQSVKFISPGRWVLVWIWQMVATLFCLAGAVALWPIAMVEELMGMQERKVEKAGNGQREGLLEINGLLDAEERDSEEPIFQG